MELLQGDCLELMKGIPDNSIDIVSTITNRLSRSGMENIDVIILLDETDDGTKIIRYQ